MENMKLWCRLKKLRYDSQYNIDSNKIRKGMKIPKIKIAPNMEKNTKKFKSKKYQKLKKFKNKKLLKIKIK